MVPIHKLALSSRLSAFFVVAFATSSIWCTSVALSAGVPYKPGDVFAGVGAGHIKHFGADGTLLDTLNTGGTEAYNTGMAFDSSGNLYASVFGGNGVYKFDKKGNLVGTFGGGYNLDPESVTLDKGGNVYVGQADGSAQILKFSPSGALLGSFGVTTT